MTAYQIPAVLLLLHASLPCKNVHPAGSASNSSDHRPQGHMNLKVKNGQSLEVCKTWDRTPVDKRLTLSLSLSLSTSGPHLECVPPKERGGGERQRLRTAGKTVAKPGRSTAGKDLDTANFTSLYSHAFMCFL